MTLVEMFSEAVRRGWTLTVRNEVRVDPDHVVLWLVLDRPGLPDHRVHLSAASSEGLAISILHGGWDMAVAEMAKEFA